MSRIKKLGNLEFSWGPVHFDSESFPDGSTGAHLVLELDSKIVGMPRSYVYEDTHMWVDCPGSLTVYYDGRYIAATDEANQLRKILPTEMVALIRRLSESIYRISGGDEGRESLFSGVSISNAQCKAIILGINVSGKIAYPSKYLDSTARKMSKWWKEINAQKVG